MKKIIFILALFVSFVANSQYTPPTGYTNINSRYDWLAGVFRALGLPAGGNASFTTGQAQRAGSVYYDSTGVDAGLKVWNGTAWVGVGEVTQSALDDTAAAIRADFPALVNIYNSDGALSGNRTITLSGNYLRALQGATEFLLIDPTTNNETSVLQAYNTTGSGNNAAFSGTTTATTATAYIGSSFNGAALGRVTYTSDNTGSLGTYLADLHEFTGDMRLAALAGNGTGLVGVDNLGNLTWTASPNLLFDSLGVAGISPVTTRNDTLYSRRISVSGGSIDTTASGGLLITVSGGSQDLQSVTDIGNITTTDITVGNTAQTPLSTLFNLDNAGAIALRATDSSFYSYLRQAGALTAPQYTFFPVGTGNDTLATLADVRAGGGGGMTNPMTTSQDIIVGGASGTPTRVGVGTEGQRLGVLSGNVTWVDNDATWNGLFLQTLQTASTSVTLTTHGLYTYVGTADATFTLPAISSNLNRIYFIKNSSSFNVTVQRAGSDNLFTTSSVTSITIPAGSSRILGATTASGTPYWHVMDLSEGSGGSGATTALDNLASVAVNTSLISDADNTDDLGSSALAWKDAYAYTFKLKNASGGITTLSPTASASNFTITTPAATGTVMLLGTNQTVSGDINFTGANTYGLVRTSSTSATSNFTAISGSAASNISTNAALQVEGSTGASLRALFNGSTAYAMIANNVYSNVTLGNTALTEPSSGNVPLISSLVVRAPTITGAAGTVSNTATVYIDDAPSATVSGGTYALWVKAGTAKFGGTVQLKGYTVATLPAGVQGDVAFVTDATAPTYLATVTGGGAVVTPVFFDGTNWVAH